MGKSDSISGGAQSPRDPLLKSFFMAGFECSTHRIAPKRRLDMIAATKHDAFAQQDYQRLAEVGMRVAREGVRWHLVEQKPGRYDFSSVRSVVHAARATGTQVIWDLCHFGWPDHIDLFKPEFVSALANFGEAFSRWLARETDEPQFFVPINEMSFFSWAAGDEGSMFPFAINRGVELKRQLARGAIVTIDAIRSVQPHARFLQVEPLVHVIAHPKHPEEADAAEAYRKAQFQAWDILSGKLWPELGGGDKYLDLVGINFYPHNQWYYNLRNNRRIRKFRPITRRSPLYRPFSSMLREVFDRYQRAMVITETGAEGRIRAGWFRYVCSETGRAIRSGLPVYGMCLYPILNHPGWADNRHCENGLWDYADADGDRKIYEPLAKALKNEGRKLERMAGNLLPESSSANIGFTPGANLSTPGFEVAMFEPEVLNLAEEY